MAKNLYDHPDVLPGEGITTPSTLNPLLFEIHPNTPDVDGIAASLVRFLSVGLSLEDHAKEFKARQQRLAPTARRIVVIPIDVRLRDKLVSPLRQAYAAFLVGNFLGTLSLCGMIGEMLAIFKFEISNIKVNGQPLTADLQRSLFGHTFEKLGQERRIEILKTYNLIDSDGFADLEKIRKIRNNYLHYWTKDHESLENDAFQVFAATVDTILRFFPQQFTNGVMHLDPSIMKYLKYSDKP